MKDPVFLNNDIILDCHANTKEVNANGLDEPSVASTPLDLLEDY
ncbi:MAG: hypothetical protein ABR555_02665 [Pyrinomonadaceae bacterium]